MVKQENQVKETKRRGGEAKKAKNTRKKESTCFLMIAIDLQVRSHSFALQGDWYNGSLVAGACWPLWLRSGDLPASRRYLFLAALLMMLIERLVSLVASISHPSEGQSVIAFKCPMTGDNGYFARSPLPALVNALHQTCRPISESVSQ